MPKNNILPKGELFTTIPDFFLSHIMTQLSASELRVMLYIYLHTLGYGKQADAISYQQFTSGIVTHDGRRLDHGAGVSRRSLVTALVSLEERGLIKRQGNGYATATIHLELNATGAITSPQGTGEGETEGRGREKSVEDKIVNNEEGGIAVTTTPHSPETVTAEITLKEKARATFEEKKSENNEAYKHSPQPKRPAQIQNRVQNLHLLQSNKGQILPQQPEKEVQDLHSTRENNGFKHEDNINRVQFAPEELSAIKTITDRVVDISNQEATRLVLLAYRKHGRDEAYLHRLISYVTTNPVIHTPAAVLTSLIKQDQDRTPASEAQFSRSRRSNKGRNFHQGESSDLALLAENPNRKYHSSNSTGVSSTLSGYDYVADLLVRQHLVGNSGKAIYITRLAQKNNIKPADLRMIIAQALLASPGQRSSCFEAIFNRALTRFNSTVKNSTGVALEGGYGSASSI